MARQAWWWKKRAQHISARALRTQSHLVSRFGGAVGVDDLDIGRHVDDHGPVLHRADGVAVPTQELYGPVSLMNRSWFGNSKSFAP